ncbi:GntR family transcriptional regulator [Burkholderia sp. L27(2015)]|uniref:GntR family transcriptional regulator n=1 Tax=Burkholderia sp. L27(2015) TaxID=1641858 RepID=UPI00131C7A47|nr:GntR family transcriptional regulator [Burkholderia sp. L27(2015)]
MDELPIRAALGASVATILRKAILDGSLKPGEPLQETALARQLSVSRSPIREALILLERERLVVSHINRPTVVRRPSAEEIRQIYTIRSVLEGTAARWAAEKATPALVESLGANAEELNTATIARKSNTDARVVALAVDFHTSIAAAADCVELTHLLESICNQIKLVMTAGLASLQSRRAEEIHAEHLDIIAAIAAHDGDRAEKLAIAHVRGALHRLIYLSDDELGASALANH